MNTYWLLETHGDPMTTLRRFVLEVWQQAGFDQMLLPLKTADSPYWKPMLTADQSRIKDFNPFIPLMMENSARQIPTLLKEHQTEKIGLFLRSCEVRAMHQMEKINGLNLEQVTTISIDCLGTFSMEDYLWRIERKGSPADLSNESWQFSRQGGILPYRYRMACQVCENSLARYADICIGIVGLSARRYLLVGATKEKSKQIKLKELIGELAPLELIEQRDISGQKMSQRRSNTQHRVTETLGASLPPNLQSMVAFLDDCGECEKCQDVCPICIIHKPRRDRFGHLDPADLLLWLNACVGCGMCEENCVMHKPVSLMFSNIKKRMANIS